MTVNFRFNNGGTDVDFDDVFIRRDIFAQGNLWAFGRNVEGQVGNNTQTAVISSPVQTVSSGLNWKQVAAGVNHSTGIKSDGSLWLWGQGTSGQLGNNAQTNRSSPVQTVSGGTNWKQVSGGFSHTACIKTDGTLWLWGSNTTSSASSGQLGNNAQGAVSSPVQTVSGGSNWRLVSCGFYHTASIKTDGTLWLWGLNNLGQLGTNNQTNYSSPVQTISGGTNWKQVSGGGYHTGAIKTDGTLWLWGWDELGALGDNTTINKSSPVQTVSGGTNWKEVECGRYHTGSIKTDGTLWLFGDNVFGQLGTNNIVYYSSPVQTISVGTNWKKISSGVNFTSAIKTDGTLWLWGYGEWGNLGDNTTISKSSPVQTISGGTNWKEVAIGDIHSLAVTDLDVYQY